MRFLIWDFPAKPAKQKNQIALEKSLRLHTRRSNTAPCGVTGHLVLWYLHITGHSVTSLIHNTVLLLWHTVLLFQYMSLYNFSSTCHYATYLVHVTMLMCYFSSICHCGTYKVTRQGSLVNHRSSTAEAPQIGKIHLFSKISVTLEPVMQFICPSRFRISKTL